MQIVRLLTHLHSHLALSYPALAQLIDEYQQSPQIVPLVYPSGASASPLSENGVENLAIRDISSAEEIIRLITSNGRFDAPLFQRVLTSTAKECTFDIAGMTTFLDLLRSNEIPQLEELSKEWVMEGIKAVIGDDGKGVWWIVANLVSVEIIAIEDVITQVVQLVLNKSGREVSEPQSLELLCHIWGLLCAESGTKLYLSLTVIPRMIHLLTIELSFSASYSPSDIVEPDLSPESRNFVPCLPYPGKPSSRRNSRTS